MAYTWDDAKAPTPADDAIVRDVRQSRHLSRRLDGLDDAARLRLGAGAEGDHARELQLGALQSRRRISPKARTSPRRMPEKLKEMEELWWAEAGRNNALPLNFSPQATVEAIFQRPSLTRGRTHFVYRQGTVRIPEGTAPTVKNTSYTITAKLNVPETGRGRRDRHAGRTVRRLGSCRARWQAGLGLQEHPAAERRHPHRRPGQARARRPRRERRFRLRRQEGRGRQGRHLRAQG